MDRPVYPPEPVAGILPGRSHHFLATLGKGSGTAAAREYADYLRWLFGNCLSHRHFLYAGERFQPIPLLPLLTIAGGYEAHHKKREIAALSPVFSSVLKARWPSPFCLAGGRARP